MSYRTQSNVGRKCRANGKALAVAVSRGAEGFEALLGTVPEVDEVERQLAGQGFEFISLIDRHATRRQVLKRFSEVGIVHLACHGVFRPDRPDASGLVMVPEPDKVEVISLRDFAQLDLGVVEHVTLSSCWGADSFVLPGRWIISLPETLCRSGTGSVLACLWPVFDDLGKEFSTRFYHHLKKLPRDLALRKTQLECLDNKLLQRETRHPVHWAGYRLHGQAGHLAF